VATTRSTWYGTHDVHCAAHPVTTGFVAHTTARVSLPRFCTFKRVATRRIATSGVTAAHGDATGGLIPCARSVGRAFYFSHPLCTRPLHLTPVRCAALHPFRFRRHLLRARAQVNIPKERNTYCKNAKCRKHTMHKVTQYKAGKASGFAQGAFSLDFLCACCPREPCVTGGLYAPVGNGIFSAHALQCFAAAVAVARLALLVLQCCARCK
jgi:hypothetical protein